MRLEYYLKAAPQNESLAITMRTPGADRELAAGYLLAEGLIRNSQDITDIRHIGSDDRNEIVVQLARTVDVDERRLARQSFMGASCGICGKRSREALAVQTPALPRDGLILTYGALQDFSQLLNQHQKGFLQTGGLHAAALIGADGTIEAEFEDIGRHNALDKLLGDALLRDRLPLHRSVVFLSSRSSFELVQKAAMAGVPILATIGGPSSLAIEAARDFGMTLAGFVRPGRMNVYSGEWRLHGAATLRV
jgi:FdhD protein